MQNFWEKFENLKNSVEIVKNLRKLNSWKSLKIALAVKLNNFTY